MTEALYEEKSGIASQYVKVSMMTTDLFKPPKIEDAFMQSDAFGSLPNWHIAHVTWFLQKVLEKYGQHTNEEDQSDLNLTIFP
jgi:hypothetical protein